MTSRFTCSFLNKYKIKMKSICLVTCLSKLNCQNQVSYQGLFHRWEIAIFVDASFLYGSLKFQMPELCGFHPSIPDMVCHLRKLFNLPLTEDRHIPGSGEGFLAIKHNFTFTVTYLKFLGFFT